MTMYQTRTSPKNWEWLTPLSILNKLGEFDLDPCAPITRPWATAKKHYTIEDDGLQQDWGNSRVWLNPPFGKYLEIFMCKMRNHNNGIALIPARTETKVFYRYVWPFASGILFLEGRPRFCDINGNLAKWNCGSALVLISYGEYNDEFLRKSCLGKFIKLKGER